MPIICAAHNFQTKSKGAIVLFFFITLIFQYFLNKCGRISNFSNDAASHCGHDVIASLHFQAPVMNIVEQQQ